MYRKEHESKALFIDPKAPEKPIGNQRIRQKAPTQCVERKKRCELSNDSLTLGCDLSSGWREPRPTSHFDCWGEKRINSSNRQAQPEIPKEHQTVGPKHRNRKLALKENRKSGRNRSERPSTVEKDVVPGQVPCSLSVRN